MKTNQIEATDFNYGPHPEERALARVSKDGSAARFRLWPSFETPAARAPQDEVDMIRTSERIVYSSLIPASLITLAHLAPSSTMTCANSFGELPTISRPAAASLVFTSSVCSTFINSRYRTSTIGCGVPAGTSMPCGVSPSWPG